MSWLFSRALVAAYSGGTSLDGARCAVWSPASTVPASSPKDRTTESFRPSRFGAMSEPLTADRGRHVLTSFLVAFPVKMYLKREGGKAWTVPSLGYGWKWPESFLRYDQSTSSWKTRQLLLQGGSIEFSGTFPRSGLVRGGELGPPGVKGRRTLESDCGLSLPTPTAQDAANNGGPSQAARKQRPLNSLVGGPLNPSWVEWLMGWPIGWTDLEPLVMGKYQQWRREFLGKGPQ